ncbi:MAG: flagellar filament capping protein FliD [Bacteroides sp.]|nr:flagellar filament capping protein FliD [Prevotella sp.]MCM1408308.1 flagellar filament capping protein FliD [Treponema brennaborense]MCM1470460.1 flagellar filament capping protein FliD [Bacteroides sp.]
MPEINIPGVSDKYKTNDLVKSLVEVEKIPLNREKERLETFKVEQENWRRVNQHMTSLRESARSLYSYDNPFNNKIASSTDEQAVSAIPARDAAIESFKIEVKKTASADRFLSDPLKKDASVPAGTYTYTAGDSSVQFKWKGGRLEDFVSGLNRRGGQTVKASIIGLTADTRALLIEGLKTGKKNALIFSDDAEKYGIDIGMIRKVQSKSDEFFPDSMIKTAAGNLSAEKIISTRESALLPPESGFQWALPSSVKGDVSQKLEFSVKTAQTADITEQENSSLLEPVLPSPPEIQFRGIHISNEDSETTLPPAPPREPRQPVEDDAAVFVILSNGKEQKLENIAAAGGEKTYSVSIAEYPDAAAIAVRNRNTGKELTVSSIKSFNANAALGFEPVQPISTADDAQLKYEGIPLSRPDNTIDDIVPGVTLNLSDVTEKPAVISVKPDIESAKEALITFTGKYNQLIAELNILTQNKPEIITELSYLTDEEAEAARKRLGALQSDFSLKNERSALQRILSASYQPAADAQIKVLQQAGISTQSVSSGTTISSSQLRGYLEIDEKKLDAALQDNIDAVRLLFGFDADDDKIVDNGIAYLLDKNLQAYVQTGGILSTKTNGLNSKIQTSEKQIQKLETQVAAKEQELKRKYGQMQGTLNSLESQSNSISNFNRQYEK